MKKRNAFTLIELLAVMVILAVILVIVVPRITDTIEKSRKGAIESSAKIIARDIENKYATSFATGNLMTSGSCMDGLNTNEYSSCTYEIDSNGEVTVSLTGSGKFGGYNCDGTKFEASCEKSNESDDAEDILMPDPQPSFADYSWSDLNEIAKAVNAGTLSASQLELIYNISVGDTRDVVVAAHTNNCASYSGSGASYVCNSSTESEKTIQVRLVNVTTPNECKTTDFSQTACGFVLVFADIIEKHNMNSTDVTNINGTNEGSWPASGMRAYLNGTVNPTTKEITEYGTAGTLYSALPNELKNIIKERYVVTGRGQDDVAGTLTNNNYGCTDKLYLLSTHEVWKDEDGDTSAGIDKYDTGYNYTRQLDYYEGLGVTTNNKSGAIMKLNASAAIWYLRAASSKYTYAFYVSTASGDGVSTSTFHINGVVPAFRIGK